MLHQRTIKALENMPNKIPTETDEDRKARLAVQEIGTSLGIHPKVHAAQIADSKLKRRISVRKGTK